jgi:hypothetical protein
MVTHCFYHLAQVNIAQMRAPLDDLLMADFVSQLAAVNAAADASPGFVWRLQTEQGDATYLRPYDDPTVLFNLSVWASVEDLSRYVYRSRHVSVLRDRQRWFQKMEKPHAALWWVPAGHIPSEEEAKSRLAHLQERGPTPVAFTFDRAEPPPAQPDSETCDSDCRVSYDGRVFTVVTNSETGECSDDTLFYYRQQSNRVWATYQSPQLRFGTLVAVANESGYLDMRYQHLNGEGDMRTGRCHSRPELLSDGRLRLHESWQWTNGDCSRGQSLLEERRS